MLRGQLRASERSIAPDPAPLNGHPHAHDEVEWLPAEFEEEENSVPEKQHRLEEENRLLKSRLADRRSMLRLPVAASNAKGLEGGPPPMHSSAEQQRKYYDNVPDSLLSRVEGAWSKEASVESELSEAYNHRRCRTPPKATKNQGLELETRIAIAQSKAMARRMLGDTQGASEYEGIARRLKRQVRDAKGETRHATRALAPPPAAARETERTAAVERSSLRDGRVSAGRPTPARGRSPSRTQKTSNGRVSPARQSPHQTTEWQNAIQERAYPR